LLAGLFVESSIYELALALLELNDTVFYRLLDEDAMDLNWSLLPNPMSTTDSLILNVRVPDKLLAA
jgi:hypothetical protein